MAAILAASSLRCGGDNIGPTEPTAIDMVGGSPQTGAAGQVLPQPLVVKVTDKSGNAVPGVTVSWSAQGGGSVSKETVKTGSDGRASVQRTLGLTPGPQTTTASAGSLEGSPVTFVATAVGGGPGVTVITQPPQSALNEEVFDPSAQPVVSVGDDGGNPLPGVDVTASLTSGTLEGTTTVKTDANGIATFGDLGIRGVGSHRIKFSAGSASTTSNSIVIAELTAQATMGSWGDVIDWDIVPLHISLMPNGKIFAWGKRDPADSIGYPRIWDPASGGPPRGLPQIHLSDMLFCAGHTLLPDGQLMVAGGHFRDDAGIKATYLFSPDGAPQKQSDMAYGRWYPTLTVLADGRVLTMAGRDENSRVVTIPEIWEGQRWVQLPGAGTLEIPYYPRNFVAPNGRIFMAGERVMSRWFDVDATGVGGGRGSWSNGPNHIWPYNRDYGTAAMYEPGKILYAGGGGYLKWPTPDPRLGAPTATAEKIDLTQTTPQWQSAGSMSGPRRHLNSTILPDGTVLITGGTRGGGFIDDTDGNSMRAAEVWDPKTNQWTTLARNQVTRVYHSVSLLLPDGTVLHGASGNAQFIDHPLKDEKNHEIFSPPYMFKGVRPRISSAPNIVNYGETFDVATPNKAQVTEVRWIRLPSVTHAFDMGQRANTLRFSATADGVNVTAPANPNLAPPGYYQLFILNRNGVPSESKIIKIQ